MQSKEKPTKFGIFSSILAVLISVLWCGYIVILMIFTQREVTSIDMNNAVVVTILFYGSIVVVSVLTFLFTIAGMILGILSLSKGEPKRFFAVAGLVINFLWLLPYCLAIIELFTSFDSS